MKGLNGLTIASLMRQIEKGKIVNVMHVIATMDPEGLFKDWDIVVVEGNTYRRRFESELTLELALIRADARVRLDQIHAFGHVDITMGEPSGNAWTCRASMGMIYPVSRIVWLEEEGCRRSS